MKLDWKRDYDGESSAKLGYGIAFSVQIITYSNRLPFGAIQEDRRIYALMHAPQHDMVIDEYSTSAKARRGAERFADRLLKALLNAKEVA